MKRMFLFAVMTYLVALIAVANANACHGGGHGHGHGGGGHKDVKKGLFLYPHQSADFVFSEDLASDPNYVGRDGDPWQRKSFVLYDGEAVLDVFNKSERKYANNVALIVAVEDLDLLDSVTVMGQTLYPEDFTEGTPRTLCHNKKIKRNKSHNRIYPSAFAEVEVGDIAPREFAQVPVSIMGDVDVKVNFLATGTRFRQHRGPHCVDLISPFKMDVTMIGGLEEASLDCNPEMSLRLLTNGEEVRQGSHYYYQIIWSSIGDCDLTEVDVTNLLPVYANNGQMLPAAEVTVAYPDPTYADDFLLEWYIGDIASWQAGDMLFEVTITGDVQTGDELINTACVESAEADMVCRESVLVVE